MCVPAGGSGGEFVADLTSPQGRAVGVPAPLDLPTSGPGTIGDLREASGLYAALKKATVFAPRQTLPHKALASRQPFGTVRWPSERPQQGVAPMRPDSDRRPAHEGSAVAVKRCGRRAVAAGGRLSRGDNGESAQWRRPLGTAVRRGM
ncbi:unnamed protein product [Leptosia nina]|uniref:Uncharacterized protein n=1 Tax=Leptosia nina TaxID=320188 RepID=A0AAV1IVD8_9NEOP